MKQDRTGVLCVLATVVVAGAVFFGAYRTLFTPRRVKLLVDTADTVEELPSGLPGVALSVLLHPGHFGGTLPDSCTLEVTLGETINTRWTILTAEVYAYSATKGRLYGPGYTRVCHGSARGRPTKVSIRGLMLQQTYQIVLYLEPQGDGISRYFNTPAGGEKKSLLAQLKREYEIVVRESLEIFFLRHAVGIVAVEGVEELPERQAAG